MKKIIFSLFVLLAVVGCKPKEEEGGGTGDVTAFAWNNGKDGMLSMSLNTMQVVSFTNGVTPSKVDITSSDESVVYFSAADGALVAISEGTAVVTAALKSNPGVTATLTVTVTAYVKNAKFYQFEYWGGKGEWDMKKYTIMRVHSKQQGYGMCNDVDLSHVGDTADIDSWTDEVVPTKWYYLYTNEEGDSMGLFTDSIYSLKGYLLSNECLFNGKGIDLAGDEGLVLVLEDHFMFTSKSWFCLGYRSFVEDVTEVGKQYVKTGGEKVPYPGALQIGHFNETNYVTYYGGLLSGESPEAADYPIFEDHDCEFIMFYTYEDETSETGYSMGGLTSGYPVLPTEETELDFYFGLSADETTMIASYYTVDAKMFKNVQYNIGLKTEVTEEGETWVQPFELDPMIDVHYEGGSIPAEMRGKNGARQHREIAMPARAMQKKMSFDRTTAATLRMVLGNR